MATPQVWELTRDGQHHRVTATSAGLGQRVVWAIDDEVVETHKSSDEKLTLEHGEQKLEVRFTKLGAARRATLQPANADLVPEPGSKAARHEDWIREHPRLHTLRATIGGTAGILLPILVAFLLARFAFSIDIPWPDVDLPDLPDLPSIPWPDLPSIPWPDIPWPDWSLPGWVRDAASALKFVFPVIIAIAIARAEIHRRRKQDELREKPDEDR